MFERIGELWLERKLPPRAGPPLGRLLLVHGAWGGSWYWAHWLRRFAEAGWDAWAVNLRGHHGSQPGTPVDGLSVGDYVGDVTRCVAAIGDAALIGHSLGGLIVQKVAEQQSPRAAILLTSAPPRGILAVRGAVIRRLSRYTGALLSGRGFVPTVADARALLFNDAGPGRGAGRLRSARAGVRPGRREAALGMVSVDAARVRCPVLVVGAERDAIVPVAIGRRLAARYRAEYRELAGHAHMPMLEEGWEAVADDLLGWLKGRVG